MEDRSVPFGKYCLSSRLVFSFVPRCQGLCGSQKYTFTSVATVNALCLAIWGIERPVQLSYGDFPLPTSQKGTSSVICERNSHSLTTENGSFPGAREMIPRFLPIECSSNHSEHPSGLHTVLTHLSVFRYVPLRTRINFSPKERALPFLISSELQIGRKGANLL